MCKLLWMMGRSMRRFFLYRDECILGLDYCITHGVYNFIYIDVPSSIGHRVLHPRPHPNLPRPINNPTRTQQKAATLHARGYNDQDLPEIPGLP